MLYPLKFHDIFKEKVWGGQRLKTILGKDFSPLPDCGEAWVVSSLPVNESVVANGALKDNTLAELAEVYLDDLLGEKVYEEYGEEFPLLLKFIDANDWLSVQVHPDDALARKRGLKRGKNELWYVVQAEPGAQLISGFNTDINQKVYLDHLNAGKLKEILNFVDVKAGDVIPMPAGRVHALGPGILIAEIQQSADITYRIYDWDRPDKNGKLRELHTDLALEAIDFSKPEDVRFEYRAQLDQTIPLAGNTHFGCGIIHLTRGIEKDLLYQDSFMVYLCVGGQGLMEWDGGSADFKKGEAVLIPATTDKIRIRPKPSASLLEVLPVSSGA